MQMIQTARGISSRGVYNQNAGELVRGGKDSGAAFLSEYCADSAIAEGDVFATFQRMLRGRDWQGVTSYLETLVKRGWARHLAERILQNAQKSVPMGRL